MAILAITLGVSLAEPAQCTDFDTPPLKSYVQTSIKTFQFPKEGVGTISLMEGSDKVPGRLTDFEKPLWTGRAAGLVKVPFYAEGVIMLKLNNAAMSSPALMRQISPAGIQALKIGLYSMTPEEVTATDKCLAQIGRFKNLQYLLVDSSDASDQGLRVVAGLNELRGINISATPVKGELFKTLARLPKLHEVIAERCNVDEDNFLYLSKSPGLEKINLRWSNISAKGLQLLEKSKSLRSLFITRESHIDDAAIAVVARMKNIRHLRLNDNPITDKNLETLSALTQLEEIGLQSTRVTDAGVVNLRKMTHLQSINLFKTSVTERGIFQLQGLRLTQLFIPHRLLTPLMNAKLKRAFPELRSIKPVDPGFEVNDDIKLLAEPRR